MYKFLGKSLLFFALLVKLAVLIPSRYGVSDQSDYLAALIDKHRLIDSLRTPKILFSGGSNLAFGLDSKEVEKAMGIPVVNLGLHAGLGLTFILNDLRSSIKKNDIVFLSIEYLLGEEGTEGLDQLAAHYYPPAQQFYSYHPTASIRLYLDHLHNRYINFITCGLSRITPAACTNDFVYTRSGFNRSGDVINHLDKPAPRELLGRGPLPYVYWKGIEDINRFNAYAKTINVKVFFLFPTYCLSEYNRNKKVISQAAADLKKGLTMEILNSPTDFVYPDSLFFNTVYHLNRTGRQQRTEKLIQLIRSDARAQASIQFSMSVGKYGLRN